MLIFTFCQASLDFINALDGMLMVISYDHLLQGDTRETNTKSSSLLLKREKLQKNLRGFFFLCRLLVRLLLFPWVVMSPYLLPSPFFLCWSFFFFFNCNKVRSTEFCPPSRRTHSLSTSSASTTVIIIGVHAPPPFPLRFRPCVCSQSSCAPVMVLHGWFPLLGYKDSHILMVFSGHRAGASHQWLRSFHHQCHPCCGFHSEILL